MIVLKFPLTKVALWFLSGMILSMVVSIPRSALLIILPACAIFTLILLLIARTITHNVLFGVATSLAMLSIGFSIREFSDKRSANNHYLNHVDFSADHVIEAALHEKLRTTAIGERFIAEILTVDGKNSSGKILLTFKGDGRQSFVGDIVLLNCRLLKPKPPSNPGQFDYGKYLSNKSIYAQSYLERGHLYKVGQQHDFRYFADRFRTTVIGRLRIAGFNADELSVVAALLLGQQQDISPDIIKSYQYAGAVHILSVSGLHIGMIALMLGYLLKPLPNTTKSRLFKMIFIISCLWIFGLIAGFAPSVVRSVTMFSLLTVGQYLKRGTNIYHTLLVSAMLILIIEPSFLFDVGFQLSYAALFFILWLQPVFSSWWSPQNIVVKYFWEILAVSFAAQIGTLPLSIYYFHQFPGLFFITNLIIIPWLSLVMAIGVAVLLMAAADITPQLTTTLLEWCVKVLNQIIAKIASVESFLFTDIPMSFVMLLLLYSLIIAATLLAKQPSYRKTLATFFIIVIIQIYSVNSNYRNKITAENLIMHTSRASLIVKRYDGKIVAYTSDAKNKYVKQTLQSYAVESDIKIKNVEKLRNLISVKQNIIILDSSAVYPKNISPDIVLLTQSSKVNLDRILKMYKPKIVVADASNYNYSIERWRQTCRKEKIPFHATAEKGFYLIQ